MAVRGNQIGGISLADYSSLVAQAVADLQVATSGPQATLGAASSDAFNTYQSGVNSAQASFDSIRNDVVAAIQRSQSQGQLESLGAAHRDLQSVIIQLAEVRDRAISDATEDFRQAIAPANAQYEAAIAAAWEAYSPRPSDTLV